VRLFTAFELSPEVKEVVLRLQAELRPLPFRRWQPEKTLHLTLHFLGEVDPALLSSLEARMQEACHGFGDFQLQLGPLGAFPSLKRPRNLWLSVAGQRDRLTALEALIRPRVMGLGIPLEDRPYSPHITLARDPQAPVVVPEVSLPPVAWTVSELVLFESTLQRGGAIHTPLARFSLT
jgi:2'-5' RNA ligase